MILECPAQRVLRLVCVSCLGLCCATGACARNGDSPLCQIADDIGKIFIESAHAPSRRLKPYRKTSAQYSAQDIWRSSGGNKGCTVLKGFPGQEGRTFRRKYAHPGLSSRVAMTCLTQSLQKVGMGGGCRTPNNKHLS